MLTTTSTLISVGVEEKRYANTYVILARNDNGWRTTHGSENNLGAGIELLRLLLELRQEFLFFCEKRRMMQ